jgi:N6 adenine-specific DNA methyltransferase
MMRKSYSPLRYPGGKSRIYNYIQHLISINNCKTYIEPYAGGAGVALSLIINGDVEKIMINDYDKSIYAFWYSVLNYTDDLIQMIIDTDITIEEWYHQKEVQLSKKDTTNLLELGFSTLFLNRVNRSGIIKGGVIGGKEQSGLYKMDCRFNKIDIINRIQLISKFKNKIKVYNLDAEYFVKQSVSKTKNSFTFFDPPYYEKGPALYTNYYEHDDHVKLKEAIKKHMKEKNWIVTYDNNENIAEMYANYYKERYYLNYSVTKPNKGIEYIIFSDNTLSGDITSYLSIVGSENGKS